jgi:hypothetical protein
MIDLSKFNLTYFCKETGREVKAYIPETGYLTILDNGEVKKLTTFKARLLYKGSRENRRAKNKPRHTRPKISRIEFDKYLNESYEKICTNY